MAAGTGNNHRCTLNGWTWVTPGVLTLCIGIADVERAARSGVIGRGHRSGVLSAAVKGLSEAPLAGVLGMTRFRTEADKRRLRRHRAAWEGCWREANINCWP